MINKKYKESEEDTDIKVLEKEKDRLYKRIQQEAKEEDLRINSWDKGNRTKTSRGRKIINENWKKFNKYIKDQKLKQSENELKIVDQRQRDLKKRN